MGKKKQTKSPEEIEAFRRWREESAARLKRAYEIVDKGLAEIDAKRAQEARRESS